MDGFAEQLGPQFEENYRRLVEQIEENTRRLGLYLNAASVVPDQERPGRVMVMARFDIGDLAWTHKVIAPELAEIDDTVREMEDGITQAQIEEIRQERLRRKGKADGA